MPGLVKYLFRCMGARIKNVTILQQHNVMTINNSSIPCRLSATGRRRYLQTKKPRSMDHAGEIASGHQTSQLPQHDVSSSFPFAFLKSRDERGGGGGVLSIVGESGARTVGHQDRRSIGVLLSRDKAPGVSTRVDDRLLHRAHSLFPSQRQVLDVGIAESHVYLLVGVDLSCALHRVVAGARRQ
jgi:hypothetical protein